LSATGTETAAPGAAARGIAVAAAIGRFVLVAVTTYLGLLAVTFFIGRIIPIDPVLAVLGDRANADVVERTRRAMGLDLPLIEQFYIYVRMPCRVISVLGLTPPTRSWRHKAGLSGHHRACPSGTLIGTLVGVPLGVLAAVRRGSLIDQVVRVIGLIGYSVPIFWLGLLGLVLFYARLQWVAYPGRLDVVYQYTFTSATGFYLLDSAVQGEWDVFRDAFRHIILPAALLGYFSLAYISRMTRSFMLNEMAQEYIVAARARGLSETRVIWAHALRNAAVPLITVIALSYAGLLEGSVLTETVFAWPGIGLYITDSLQNADMNAVLGGTIVIGSVFIAINLLSDVLYRLLDPRTKAQ